MESDELAAIRAARLNQIKQSGGSGGSNGGDDANGEAAQRQEAEMRRDVIASVLDSGARERRGLLLSQ